MLGFGGSKLWDLKGTLFGQVPLSIVLAISMPYPLFKVNIDRKLHFISHPKRIRKMTQVTSARMFFSNDSMLTPLHCPIDHHSNKQIMATL